MIVYPIKFEPIYIPRLWGREIWQISDMPDAVSIVANGVYKGKSLSELMKDFGKELISKGNAVMKDSVFPLLIKILEADQTLSVQVHPNNDMAKSRRGCRGKDEMWYVMEANEGVQLVAGFNMLLTPQDYEERVHKGTFSEVLRHYRVRQGDVFCIPAGRVHALGGGIKVAEIQQSSDTTYRIYDYGRRDEQGNLRELHIKEAEEAIDYLDADGDALINYSHIQNTRQPLVSASSFTTSIYEVTELQELDYSKKDSFVVLMCVEGECSLTDENGFAERLACGEAVLIPAALNFIKVAPEGSAKILETYVC